MKEAELFDGTVLEFPDDTPDEVISRVAKEQTLAKQQTPAPTPEEPAPVTREIPDLLDPANPLYGQRHGGSFVTGIVDEIRDKVSLAGEVQTPADPFTEMGQYDIRDREKRALEAGQLVTPMSPGKLTTQGTLGIARAEQKSLIPGSKAAAPMTPKPTGEVAAAANRQDIDVPVAAATDSMLVQRAAQAAKNVPGAGNPIVRATERTVDQLGTKADELASGMGGAGMEQAGETASKGVTGWVKTKSDALTGKAYKAVDGLVDPAVKTPLATTRYQVAEIASKRSEAALQPGSAVNIVMEAVQRPEGLTYEGIKTLRTQIGGMMDNGLLPADISRAELKQIYGALTDDLKKSVEAAGGEKALAAFNRANSLNRVVSQRRESLAKLIGKGGDRTPAQVYDRLLAAAGSKSRADTALLLQARKAIGQEDWKEYASAVVGRLGRDADGGFSPDRFVADFGKLSESGKKILFGTEEGLRQSLDDIATISKRLKEVSKKFGNPSGTSQTSAGIGTGAALMVDPITTVSALVGANAFSRIVSRPAVAKAMRDYAKTAETLGRVQTPAAKAAVERAKAKMLEIAERAAIAAANDNISSAAASGQ